MIPELGQLALIIALLLSLLQALCAWVGDRMNKEKWVLLCKPLSVSTTFFIVFSFLILLYSFSVDDFSIQYVAEHSNSSLAWYYKIAAAWSGHEGSLLLWIVFLAFWTLLVNLKSNALPRFFLGNVLAYLGITLASFLIFLLWTSNPFVRQLPNVPLDGTDLNPLLQDVGLIFHPPILYFGLVGLAVPAAFAVASLLEKTPWSFTINSFAVWIRPWVLAPFAFLTLGVAWGSYWAYYELGWGGWWFWDPVENASFMPWLSSIALIHTLIVLRKRALFYLWTLLLAIATFALSLLATFLVRSGVLTSVHAFANDPKRGVFILLLMLLLIGPVLLLFALRAKTIYKQVTLEFCSRESLLLFNSILLMVAVFSILLGTLFPMAYDLVTGKKISVGFPYFNAIFIPLMMPVLLSIPLGPFVRFGSDSILKLFSTLKWSFWASVGLALCFPFLFSEKQSFSVFLGLFLASWVCLGTLQRLLHKIKEGGFRNVSNGAWGMILAHFGVGLLVLGITVVSNYQIEQDLRLLPKQVADIHGYEILFDEVQPIEGSNFVGYRAVFKIQKNNQFVATLFPEKRHYVVQNVVLTETALDAGLWRDIYISLGERFQDTTWTVRLYYKPFVRFIWLGALMIALACFLLLFGKHKHPKMVSSLGNGN